MLVRFRRRGRRRAAGACLGHARIHPGHDEVDREVGDDDHEPDHEHDPEDHGQVESLFAVERTERRQPEARQPVDRLDVERDPEREADVHPDERQHRAHRVPQRVMPDDARPRHALGLGRADERLVHHLDHPHPHEARVDREEEESERDPGQDQVGGPRRRAGTAEIL